MLRLGLILCLINFAYQYNRFYLDRNKFRRGERRFVNYFDLLNKLSDSMPNHDIEIEVEIKNGGHRTRPPQRRMMLLRNTEEYPSTTPSVGQNEELYLIPNPDNEIGMNIQNTEAIQTSQQNIRLKTYSENPYGSQIIFNERTPVTMNIILPLTNKTVATKASLGSLNPNQDKSSTEVIDQARLNQQIVEQEATRPLLMKDIWMALGCKYGCPELKTTCPY